MGELSNLFDQIVEVCRHLFSSRQLIETLSQEGYMAAALVVINLVVFVETGLLVGFCLPGDSLLVSAGIVCYASGWNLPLLLITVSLAAIVGDTVGYYIGWRTGPKIFKREKSLLFAKDHLLKAQQFYERHGGKTIILARFMPIIRTFAPVVAGVGKMKYSKFLFYNVFGGVGWVFSMVLLGYILTPALDPWLRRVFGEGIRVQDHIEKVIVLVVLASISPGLFLWARNKLRKRNKTSPPGLKAVRPEPVTVPAGNS